MSAAAEQFPAGCTPLTCSQISKTIAPCCCCRLAEVLLQSNYDLSDWELSPEQFKQLSSLKFQARAGSGPEKTAFWWSVICPEGPYK